MHINVSKYLILLLTCSRHSIFIIQDTYIYLPAFVDVDTISDHLTSFLLPLVVFNSVVIYFFFFFFFFFSIGWRLFLCFDCQLYVFIVIRNTSGRLALKIRICTWLQSQNRLPFKFIIIFLYTQKFKMTAFRWVTARIEQIFQKSESHVKILGDRRG